MEEVADMVAVVVRVPPLVAVAAAAAPPPPIPIVLSTLFLLNEV